MHRRLTLSDGYKRYIVNIAIRHDGKGWQLSPYHLWRLYQDYRWETRGE